VGHVAACAVRYWNGRWRWGDREVLAELEQSDSAEDRLAADEIGQLKTAAFEWMEATTPVDWTSPEVKAALLRLLRAKFPWCDDLVLTRAWEWLSWLGWHDGY
jgi:hypothetical protein